jgi:CHAT domain-containing protein
MVAGRRVIHLATHGFSLDDVCRTPRAAQADKAAGGLEASGSAFPVFGLALADVNRREIAAGRADAEDGILTADEIAALDLRGVEWAVLSGCQTGVGPALRGEGVLGLRRAFQVAGAKTLVMSLWAVGDHDALEWILELYRARLAGRTTAEAIRAASLRVLENRRRAGAIAHPHFWGAFVAAGDWR